MKSIKTVKLFTNENEQSKAVYNILKTKLLIEGFDLVGENPELSIAIGGDGSFIRMLKTSEYNENTMYVGINAGTLGFLQEIEIKELDFFVQNIKNGNYTIIETGIQKNTIKTKTETKKFHSLNEIMIRRKDLSLAKFDINIDNIHTERFIGDALIICTSVGSTAHSLSYGGAIIHDSLYTMQLIPVGAVNNIINQTLKNPMVLPDNVQIEILPIKESSNIIASIDGENFEFNEVKCITTNVCSKKIKRLRLNHINFFKKLNSKFVTK
ncbi:MAG: hypothetical protein WCX32_03120 [Clostridia bacterium]|jgi:NAD+ kinase|nr:hypothetical protein [Clostridia bacterium]MDD4275768.1 hypothetical protein [Clostridia bacterium]